MTFRNTRKTMAVENMMVTMSMPDAMMLTSSSNSFYIESLAAEGTITAQEALDQAQAECEAQIKLG